MERAIGIIEIFELLVKSSAKLYLLFVDSQRANACSIEKESLANIRITWLK